jgi:hypothetical protein
MEVKYREIPFEEVQNIPETIYKYRTWGDKWHKTILTEQAVFLAQPTSFEDKLDCKNLVRYDWLTPVEIYHRYYNHSKVLNPNGDDLDHRYYAVKEFYKSPLFDQNHIREFIEDYFKGFDLRFGVLSLTANPKNNAMWNKYSEAHKGFCVGFHAMTMFTHLGGGGEVNYIDALPDILPSDEAHAEHWKQVFFKEKKWTFEEEYRTHKFWRDPASTADRTIKLAKDCYKEIIFGADMSEDHQNEVINVCKQQGLNVAFFKARRGKNDVVTIEEYTFNN